MFGIRELSLAESSTYCSNGSSVTNSTPPINDQSVNFTSNYHIRAYTSACYYLDKNSYWDTDGIVVSRIDILK
jgi:hypothetical protein